MKEIRAGRVEEIRAMLREGNETFIANCAGSSLSDLLEEIDALRARLEAAECDLAKERGCCTCWYLNRECPDGCGREGARWVWRMDAPEQSAPGGAL